VTKPCASATRNKGAEAISIKAGVKGAEAIKAEVKAAAAASAEIPS
jgi:hypothetical protein